MKLLLLLALFPFTLCALPCGHIGPGDEGPSTLPLHRSLSLSMGTKTVETTTVTYSGFLLGLAHCSMGANDIQRIFADERCNVRGCSLQLFAQSTVGTTSGVAISGLTSDTTTFNGLQLSGLANRTDTLNGVQIALAINRSEDVVRGVQVGLLNLAGDLKGIQIGLLNTNAAGLTLPLLNFSW